MGQLRLQLRTSRWVETLDGDPDCLAMFERHYSCQQRPPDVSERKLFVGPGEKLVLVTPGLDALFAWRKFIDDSGQAGVNCAVFRNESAALSSSLILEAEPFAWRKWPDETRLYTYVDPKKTKRKRDPGRCFRRAGWRPCGWTKKRGLLILEKTLADYEDERPIALPLRPIS